MGALVMRCQGKGSGARPPAHECDWRGKTWFPVMIGTPEPEHSRKPNSCPNPECSTRREAHGGQSPGRQSVCFQTLIQHLPTTVTSLSLSKDPFPLIYRCHSCTYKYNHTKTKKKVRSWPARFPMLRVTWNQSRVIIASRRRPKTDTTHPSDNTGSPKPSRLHTYTHTVFWQECAELSSRPGPRKKAGLSVTVGFPKVSLVLARCLWAHVEVCLTYRDNPA